MAAAAFLPPRGDPRRASRPTIRVTTDFLKTLLAGDIAEVDRVLRESLNSDVAADRAGRRAHHRRRRQAAASRAAAAVGARLRLPGHPPPHAGRGGRDDPHRDAAARRRRRRLQDAPRPRHGQHDVRQFRERAGRRLPLFPRVPAHGGPRLAARAGDPLRSDQRDRRGRGAAAHQFRRPRPRRERLSRRDPAQDGEAVRSRGPPRRGARAGASAGDRRRCSRATACISARPSSSSTTCSTIPATSTPSARTSATTSPKAR